MLRDTSKWPLFRQLDYRPHTGQREFHDSDARFKLLIAGARFGKSLATAREALSLLAIPGTRGWIVAPSYRLGEKELRYIVDDLRGLGWGSLRANYGGTTGPSSLITPWGAELHALSAMQPDNLLGEELDWLVLSESARLDTDVWTRYLRARLTTREGRMFAPSTPAGYNWLHELYLRGLDPSFPQWRSFHYRTADNPLIGADEIEEARRTLPPETFAEQFEGAFTSRAGLIYPEFEPRLHVRERFDFAGDWERVGAMDFGYANPMVLLFAAIGQGGRVVIYDEYFAIGRTLSAHLDRLMERGAKGLCAIYADPSGAQWIAELQGKGFNIQAAPNDVLYGIDLVRRRLLPGADGGPGLVVLGRCVNLVREFTRYRYDETRDGSGEQRPLKQDDHALDALRYLLLALEKRVRWRTV
ncbi:MAG: terminase family protein [Planctomycetes bacterium]|nr:terminase family protein [Planctomycetota bacterium]NUQ35049.1 hypothetical protein [Planctomycetaceae bacterium]